VEVLGDRERLRVVFENLLENAIKYNRPHGEVRVSYARQNGVVRIEVADTGVGIAADHLPRIFERFYRVDKNRSREVGGTGLGLAIVKHIVEAHGSTVHVESTVGKGSTFWFTLKS
jgi:two-component system phosphate regulon sensor histidine kinase PhoR